MEVTETPKTRAPKNLLTRPGNERYCCIILQDGTPVGTTDYSLTDSSSYLVR